MRLFFETHSTSVDNERRIASGHLDSPLSHLGRRQAMELGARYSRCLPSTIITSDLARAVSTAELAFGATGLPHVRDDRLRECDYGAWSGCSVEKLDQARASFVEEPFPGGESYIDVVRRVDDFLAALRDSRGPVLIIAHRAPWYALEHLLQGRELVEVVTSPWRWQPGWEYNLRFN